jgi:hypothetical protein
LWGGAGGGGRGYCADYVLKHPIDIPQDVIIPISQHAITVRLKTPRAFLIGRRSLVLAAIDLDDNASRVTNKICDVAADPDLPTEMRAGDRNSMPQVPPELALSVRRRGAHGAGQAALLWHDRTIALRPHSRLAICRHVIAS